MGATEENDACSTKNDNTMESTIGYDRSFEIAAKVAPSCMYSNDIREADPNEKKNIIYIYLYIRKQRTAIDSMTAGLVKYSHRLSLASQLSFHPAEFAILFAIEFDIFFSLLVNIEYRVDYS